MRVLAYTLAVALGTGVLFGLVPAVHVSRQDIAQALKDADQRATAGGRHLRARSLLVVAEVALALMLLVGAALAMRSLARVQQVDTGFTPENLLTVEVALPPGRYRTAADIRRFWSELERRLAALPEVESASVSAGLPFAGASESSFFPMGEPRGVDSVKMAVAYFVDANYIETMKIPLLAGRTFGPQDRPDAPAGLIIDEHLAHKFFPGQDPVGQRLQRLVAANMTVVVRTRGEPHALTAQVRATVRAIDPEQPIFAVSTLEEHIARTLAQRRFTISLLGAFAGLALVLAAVGLYAVMAHAVVQRTHELGVRLSLGAQPRAVVALVVRQGMRLVGAGVLLGLVGAFALSRVMASLLSDDIGAADPVGYLGVTAALALVGLTATWIPARRATRIDPMVAMRRE